MEKTKAIARVGEFGWSRGSLHYEGAILTAICQSLKKSPEELLEQVRAGLPITTGNEYPKCSNCGRQLDSAEHFCPGYAGKVFIEFDTPIRALDKLRNPAESKPFPMPSIQEVIDAYLTHMEDSGAAEGYIRGRARKLKFFAAYVVRLTKQQHPEPPTDPEVIRTYLRQFKTKDVPTRQDNWKALKGLYDFVYRKNPGDNPMLEVEKPRFKKKPGKRLSRDQAKSYIAAIRTDLEWGLVTLYFGLRFRRVEAERLSAEDIKSDYIIVCGKKRTEELPLLPVFRDRLLTVVPFSIHADTMAYHIEQVGKRIGVRVTPHMLRNTAAALWYTYGGDKASNRLLLRHSTDDMTDHYSNEFLDELRIKDERHNPMLNLMRELGLVPSVAIPSLITTPCQITTGVLVTDPAKLLPELLDQLVTLGETAKELQRAFSGNGHKPEELESLWILPEKVPRR